MEGSEIPELGVRALETDPSILSGRVIWSNMPFLGFSLPSCKMGNVIVPASKNYFGKHVYVDDA